MQQPNELSVIPGQSISNRESFQEPPGAEETRTVSSPHPHSTGLSRDYSPPAAQTSSGQVVVFAGSDGGQQPMLNEGGDAPSSDHRGSVTPTPKNTRTVTTTPLDTPTPLPREFQSGQAHPLRKGKGRRLAPYSDEENSTIRDDVSMRGSPDPNLHQQQYGGVCFISVLMFVNPHLLVEPTCN